MALNNIVGKIPTYLRPPYSSCDAACQADMSDLGYHLIYFDVDTDDYQQINASRIQNSKDWFKGNITKSGATPEKNDWLAISHDIIEQTANNLTEYMLSTLTQLGYKAVTVGECLGDPEENWYRQFGDSADRTGNSSTPVSTTSSQVFIADLFVIHCTNCCADYFVNEHRGVQLNFVFSLTSRFKCNFRWYRTSTGHKFSYYQHIQATVYYISTTTFSYYYPYIVDLSIFKYFYRSVIILEKKVV